MTEYSLGDGIHGMCVKVAFILLFAAASRACSTGEWAEWIVHPRVEGLHQLLSGVTRGFLRPKRLAHLVKYAWPMSKREGVTTDTLDAAIR